MAKKLVIFVFLLALVANLCGCVALVAGAAGGAGTAVWLSGKLTQEVNAPLDKSVKAVKRALSSLKLKVTKETTKDDVVQFMSKYSDDKTVWIDVHKVSDSVSRIDIRVGMSGDKVAARKILDKILRYL